MKTPIQPLAVACSLLAAGAAHAFTYVDVTGSFNPDGSPITGTPNTQTIATAQTGWDYASVAPNDWSGEAPDPVGLDGNDGWRFRNSGPGAPAFNGTAFTGRFTDGDPALRTAVNTLMPNTAMIVRVYTTLPSNLTSRFAGEVSTNLGGSWTLVSNFDPNLVFVDNATGVGTPLVGGRPANGDSRAYLEFLGATNGAGFLVFDLRVPENFDNGAGGTATTDRFNIDGYAYVVPEPASSALAGLGLAFLAIRRRR